MSAGMRSTREPAAGTATVRPLGAGKSKVRNDHMLAYIAGTLIIVLVIGFVAGWAYLKPTRHQIGADIAFAKIGPLHVETEGYTYNASLVIQTDAGNARWATKNKDALNDLLYRTLAGTDPKILRTPAGLVAMQQTLTRVINETLDQPRVQQVLFTDFVSQAD
jgi:flagellar basal body-associated protein FliL